MNGILSALEGVLARIAVLAQDDAELRAYLRQVGQELVVLADSLEPAPPRLAPDEIEIGGSAWPESLNPAEQFDAKDAPPPSSPQISAPTSVPVEPEPKIAPPPRLWPHTTTRVSSDFEVSESELTWIYARCALKAEAARAAAKCADETRANAPTLDAEIEALWQRADDLPDCQLWMLEAEPGAATSEEFDMLAGNFQALAAAVDKLQLVLNTDSKNHEALQDLIHLMAEAQSGLRVAIEDIGAYRDFDQSLVFLWLKQTATERHIYIPRYMRLNDAADPDNWRELLDYIEQYEVAGVTANAANAIAQTAPNNGHAPPAPKPSEMAEMRVVEQCARRIATSCAEAANSACLSEWQTLMQAADALVAAGMPPSNVQVRDALLPILDAMPEALQTTRNFALVLREIDRYLAQRPPTATDLAAESVLTEDVRRVARLLRGRSIVLVGGDRRPHAESKLTTAFGIAELVWVDTKSYQSHTICEPHIARKDVAVVMLAIRWASHGLKEIKEFCDKYDKPLVYLPQGYNPNQVALRILQQAGERLEAEGGEIRDKR